MKPRRVNLHIDRLVIDSRLRVDSKRFGSDLRISMARHIERHPLPPSMQSSTEIRSLDAGTVQLSPSMRTDGIAQYIAQRVCGSRGLKP
jgi:hypothetical protein